MILIPRDDRYELPWWERGNLSAVPPPPGLTSNFVDPPSKASWDTVTQAVCLTVATLLVAMRMYTKIKVLKKPGWDDYTSLLAWLGLIILAILCLEEDRHGNGRHSWDITGYQYVAYAKLNYVVQILYNPTIFLTKASILLLYLRAFNPVRRTCIILYIVLWANFTFYLAAIVGEAFQCLPVEKAWLPLMSGRCINQIVAQTASAAINTFSDFVILVVPIANVWGLQLYRKGRVGLFVIFSFGALACIASIFRLVEFAKKQPIIEGAVDETWDFYALNLISIAEITSGLICSCLPALPTFLRHISDIKVKILKTSSFTSSRLNTRRRPTPDALSSPHGPTVLPSSPTAVAKSPTYSIVKSMSPTKTGWRDRGGGGRRHQWEELDELEYVAGDDERFAVKECGIEAL